VFEKKLTKCAFRDDDRFKQNLQEMMPNNLAIMTPNFVGNFFKNWWVLLVKYLAGYIELEVRNDRRRSGQGRY